MMNSFDMRRYEMLVRVRAFGSRHANLFPTTGIAGKAFADIAAAIQDVDTHAADHETGRGTAHGGTTDKASAREELRETLESMVRTARAMALDNPKLANRFKGPNGTGDYALLTAARRFVREAADLKDQFVAYDMPESFLEDLAGEIADFESALDDRAAGKQTHVSARAALDEAMGRALNALRRLDAAVPNRLADDAARLAAWSVARRVAPHPRRGVRVSQEEDVTPIPPASSGSEGAPAAVEGSRLRTAGPTGPALLEEEVAHGQEETAKSHVVETKHEGALGPGDRCPPRG
jgi:hypothetical protein